MSGLDMVEDIFLEEQRELRRHPVRRFFFRLFVIFVLLVIAGALYVWRYQPVTNGDTYGLRGDHVRETESVGGSSVVTYGAGESFQMVFSIRNSSPVPIRVTSVPDSQLAPVLSSYEVSLMPPNATGYTSRDAEPFRAFDLRPGGTRLLDLSYTFKDCGAPASAGNRTVRRQLVRYELVPRLTRVADVALAQPLVITRLPSC